MNPEDGFTPEQLESISSDLRAAQRALASITTGHYGVFNDRPMSDALPDLDRRIVEQVNDALSSVHEATNYVDRLQSGGP